MVDGDLTTQTVTHSHSEPYWIGRLSKNTVIDKIYIYLSSYALREGFYEKVSYLFPYFAPIENKN